MGSPAVFSASPDDAARRRALAVDRSFLVQAPAGSGKTELLIQRFLALLAVVPAPESVLAITFTRKAAGEMQHRVLSALQRVQRGEVPGTPHERLTHELAVRAFEQDARMGWQLAEHPSRMRIQTIDSLCAAITRQMPWLARLGAQPAATEKADPLYLEAARRALAQIEAETPHRASLETVLAHLDNNIGRAADLVVDMLRRRDQWLPLVAGGEVRREDLERAMRNAVSDGLERANRLMPEDVRPGILAAARAAAGYLTSDPPLDGWPDVSADSLPLWLDLSRLLLTKEGGWRKTVNKNHGFPPKSASKERFLALLETLHPNEDLREALELIRWLPPAAYTDEQWRVMLSLFEVLKLAVAHLKLAFRESGEADFCEVAERARLALGSAAEPSDLALGLDARIRHVLVDEFQDTSVAQFELLEKLTAGWEPGDGRTLFLVGDPMQSIYRFRQAEVGLFLKMAGGAVGEVAPEPLALNANHRSVPGIVARVNEIFDRVLAASDDIGTGAVAYSACVSTRTGGAREPVTIHALARGDDRAEADLVSELVRGALAADPEGTVAILVRARTHLPEIVAALKRNGLSFRAIDIDPLAGRPVVRDLLALTRAMLHPADRPSWLAILRAPWCGLTLADLHALVSQASPPAARSGEGACPPAAVWDSPLGCAEPLARQGGAVVWGSPLGCAEPLARQSCGPTGSAAGEGACPTVWDLLGGQLAALSEDGRERVSKLRRTLEAAFAERGRWPLRRWVERTWAALGGPACLETDDGLRDARDFLDLLENHETAGDLPDLDGFHARMTDLYAQPDSSAGGRLHILTIYKAKGLQFDTVILPGLGRVPPPDPPALLLSAERPRPDGSVDRLLATIREASAEHDPVYRYLQQLEKQKRVHETARLLYVAATRARERLHLIGHARRYAGGDVRPESGSLLEQLWAGLRQEERERFAAAAGETAPAAGEPAGAPLRRLPLTWRPPSIPAAPGLPAPQAAPAGRPRYLWVGDQLRHVGTVVHAALQRLARGEGAGSYRSALANLGVVPDELDEAAARVEEAVNRTLASERGRWILAAHPEARSEYAVAGVVDGEFVRGVIDRTFVDSGGARWIIDYKTSMHEGGGLAAFLAEEVRRYRPQMERYARLLAAEGRPVRMGLYFPLLDAWQEVRPEHPPSPA